MNDKLLTALLFCSLLLISCWKKPGSIDEVDQGNINTSKVIGYRPVYGSEDSAKRILYTAGARPVGRKGNIYAFQNYIFQVEPGTGIHVIDNTTPSAAARIGFIEVRGCSQISIKDNKLYTNSYDDLVVLDFSNLNDVKVHSRLKGVFTEYRFHSLMAEPPGPGYYECPAYDKFVVSWVRDSVYRSCVKN